MRKRLLSLLLVLACVLTLAVVPVVDHRLKVRAAARGEDGEFQGHG